MCRNIRTLHNFEPPATESEIADAALQYVRKISGTGSKPSKVNQEAFERAVDEITAISLRLLHEQLHTTANNHDYKSQLQEKVQVDHGSMPGYSIIREDGPDHDKTFRVALKVLDIETQGCGKSKKAAEQDAARLALQILKKAP